MPAPPTVVSSRDVHRTPWMLVREDVLAHADGHRSTYTYVVRPPFTAVVPFDGEAYWLVEQHRHPMGARSLELPQGGQPPGDDRPLSHQQVGEEELAQECGLVAAQWTPLGVVHEATGTSGQAAHAFLATGLSRHPDPPARDATEDDMTVHRLTEAELHEAVRAGRITDATTLACLTLLRLRS